MVLLSCTLAAVPTLAHHSGTAFDNAQTRAISGVVVQFLWTNPHTWIYLEVSNANGGKEEYHFEGMSVSILARSGWNSRTIKPGDQVSITYAPYKDERKGGEYRLVTFPDGRTLRWNTL